MGEVVLSVTSDGRGSAAEKSQLLSWDKGFLDYGLIGSQRSTNNISIR